MTPAWLGWGRRANPAPRNPIGLIFPSFDNRDTAYSTSGTGDFGKFFHGRVGLFGGAVWHTPLDGLALTVEYDSDTYTAEKASGNFSPRSQVNYGLSYDLSEQAVIGLDWLYGRTLGGSLSLRLDPVHPQYPQKIEPPPPPVVVRSGEQQQQALAALLGQRDPQGAATAEHETDFWPPPALVARLRLQHPALNENDEREDGLG